jgi:hypothetical protein
LNVGSFALGFGAEKNDESALASLTGGAVDLVSFLTTTGFKEEAPPTAAFLTGAAFLLIIDGSLPFRFFVSGHHWRRVRKSHVVIE